MHAPTSTRRALVAGGLALAVAACASPPETAEPSEDAAALHALGVLIAQQMQSKFHVDEPDLASFEQGIRDYYAGTAQTMADDGAKIQAFQRSRMRAAAEAERTASAAYLDEQARAEGAQRLESGLVFIEVAPGEGDPPEPGDFVRVRYEGSLRDGIVFDSNLEGPEPAEFPLSGLIPCWQEALGHMRPGGRATIFCPSDLAYGDVGSQPFIAGGAALRFEIELLAVTRAER